MWGKKKHFDPFLQRVQRHVICTSTCASGGINQTQCLIKLKMTYLQKSDITPQPVVEVPDKSSLFIPAKGTVPLKLGTKNWSIVKIWMRKLWKRRKQCQKLVVRNILHAIWNNDKAKWDAVFKNINKNIMGILFNNMISNMGLISLNASRYSLRHKLHQLSYEKFAWGWYTSISALLECLLAIPNETPQKSIHCYNHHIEEGELTQNNTTCLITPGTIIHSVQSWMTNFRLLLWTFLIVLHWTFLVVISWRLIPHST